MGQGDSARTSDSDDEREAPRYHAAMSGPSAETAYLFRHALLRDAAYSLQLPSDRARLHELAFYLIEQAFGGRAPEPPPLESIDPPSREPHPTDPIADELVQHIRLAADNATNHALLLRYLRRAAEWAGMQHRPETATALWLDLAGRTLGSARGEALCRAGASWLSAGRPQRAIDYCNQAIEVESGPESRRFLGLAYRNLAVAYQETGRVQLAQPAYTKALELLAEAGDNRALATTLVNLANYHLQTGQVNIALEHYGRALDMSRAAEDRNLEGSVLTNMSTACRQVGDLERAEELSLAALAIQRQLGNRRSEAISLSSLANVFYETGRVEQARELLEQSLAIHREVGNRRSEGVALTGLASVYQAAGQLEKAEHLFRDALNIHREAQNRRAEGIVIGNLAELLRITKRAAEARDLFVLALKIHTECGNAAFLGGHTCNYALCLLALRNPTSRETWQRGFDELKERQNRKEMQRAVIAMRKACTEAGVPPFEVPDGEAE